MSLHKQPKIKVATMSLNCLRDRLRELLRGARGHKLTSVIERINPVLRGWAGYFKLSQSKRPLEELDGWGPCVFITLARIALTHNPCLPR